MNRIPTSKNRYHSAAFHSVEASGHFSSGRNIRSTFAVAVIAHYPRRCVNNKGDYFSVAEKS